MKLKTQNSKLKIGVLIGNGGRLPAIVKWAQGPEATAAIELVVTYKRQSSGVEWARAQALKAEYLPWPDYKALGHSRAAYDAALGDLLEQSGIELVVLAGWGLMLSRDFVQRFAGRIINVHPALLTADHADHIALADGRIIPVFRGHAALELALKAGVDTTGSTVHYVTEAMDVGPIILQQEVPILPADTLETLAERVHAAEDDILPRAIALACQELSMRYEV